ncbi:MAG: hypothetical protein PF569_04360 [Candidatus Woesearchaeota archaeon]|jgi:hypothetical protein|nr:hypothetical protein [Candidatus Woesearchaeota archaeon]
MSKFSSNFKLDFGDLNIFYYNLLIEEDFDFRSKDIKIEINKNESLEIDVICNSVTDLKIGVSAFIKSLEIIEKTRNV